jgi:decaprenylphospho-beta-D-ribofuranose 2-oxidase
MEETIHKKISLSSFDKNYSARVNLKNPKTHEEIEKVSSESENLISRGAGYSYVAASFKNDALSLCMKNFKKILKFDKEKKLITVESGITMIELLSYTLSFGLWIPQVPGYPFISIGGAVATNVHGKSAGSDGTIRNVIKEVLIFNKNNGWLNLSQNKNKDIFDLTIGGLGLTGTIVSVTLQLSDFDCLNFETTTNKTKSINETIDFIKDNSLSNNFIYSWNKINVNTNINNFGEGIIFTNKINHKNKGNLNNLNIKKNNLFKYLTTPCLWNNKSIKIFNYMFYNYYSLFKKNVFKEDIISVIFPFSGKELYFSFFGKKGFIESQILIPYENIEEFLESFKKLVDLHKPLITLFSAKGMSGEQKYLRFEGNMICLTFDFVKNNKNLNFIKELDKLYIKYKILPSIIKDSRLTKNIFNECYMFADKFRKDLKDFDNKRSYKSELSDRLDL